MILKRSDFTEDQLYWILRYFGDEVPTAGSRYKLLFQGTCEAEFLLTELTRYREMARENKVQIGGDMGISARQQVIDQVLELMNRPPESLEDPDFDLREALTAGMAIVLDSSEPRARDVAWWLQAIYEQRGCEYLDEEIGGCEDGLLTSVMETIIVG